MKLQNVEPQLNNRPVEIWGGVECTMVRIKDLYYDQIEKLGFEKGIEDLKLYSELGIRTIRYPLLWEKFALDTEAFYRTNDARLRQVRKLGINPIAGLLHHGSGPFYTSPFDNDFPDHLADYAYKIARRYPWINYYTPVNEPLTTARFSGLYGIWYPHRNDNYSFHRIFLNEMKGVVLAMQAIRSVNPNAQLIQTEDLCKIHSTEILKYQADFENIRKWLTYDILTGKLTPEHPLWSFMTNSGIDEENLSFFTKNKTIPAICGFNYYISSERYLDHAVSEYPTSYHGGNGLHKYADIEAVRVPSVEVSLYNILNEAWDRYGLPMALTEVHMSCTREEQLRWFHETWQTASKIRSEGKDLRALTVWSFLGSYDWNSLLRESNNYYESGVFDIRSGKARPTALAAHIKNINKGNDFNNQILQSPGWWRRDIRNQYVSGHSAEDFAGGGSPILILGGTGSLGIALAKICHTRGLHHRVINRDQLEVTSRKSIENIISAYKPWAVINATGYTDIDKAERAPADCFRVNTLGPALLAEVCKENKIKLVTFSSDQVFNGKKRNPYHECDITEPLNIYGESKKKAEEAVLLLNPEALIIRSSSFYNPWHDRDPLTRLLTADHHPNHELYFPSDIIFSPTYVADLVNTTLDLLIDNEFGIWHMSNKQEISFSNFISLVFNMAGYNSKNIVGVPFEKLKYPAERPQYSVLYNSRGVSLAPLESALEKYMQEITLMTK